MRESSWLRGCSSTIDLTTDATTELLLDLFPKGNSRWSHCCHELEGYSRNLNEEDEQSYMTSMNGAAVDGLTLNGSCTQ